MDFAATRVVLCHSTSHYYLLALSIEHRALVLYCTAQCCTTLRLLWLLRNPAKAHVIQTLDVCSPPDELPFVPQQMRYIARSTQTVEYFLALLSVLLYRMYGTRRHFPPPPPPARTASVVDGVCRMWMH